MFNKKGIDKYKVEKLFVPSNNIKQLSIGWLWPMLENLGSVVLRIGVFLCLFVLFNDMGEWLSTNEMLFGGKDFDASFLYSMFLLPLLYSLRDVVDFFDACWTRAYVASEYVVVKRGWLYTSFDKLYIKDIDNAEMYKSFLGKKCGYSKITLYAPGGFVVIPFIKDNKQNYKIIKKLLAKIEKNQLAEQY